MRCFPFFFYENPDLCMYILGHWPHFVSSVVLCTCKYSYLYLYHTPEYCFFKLTRFRTHKQVHHDRHQKSPSTQGNIRWCRQTDTMREGETVMLAQDSTFNSCTKEIYALTGCATAPIDCHNEYTALFRIVSVKPW